jgi:hypothetical protein
MRYARIDAFVPFFCLVLDGVGWLVMVSYPLMGLLTTTSAGCGQLQLQLQLRILRTLYSVR